MKRLRRTIQTFRFEDPLMVARCKDCNANLKEGPRALAAHKRKDGCKVIPGVRAQVAELVASAWIRSCLS
jgi:hypothetical protein